MSQVELKDREEELNNRISILIEKLPTESPTKKQLSNHLERFKDSVSYLINQEHKLAFIGNIGAGKTTAICHLLGLIDGKDPILSTGSGRTTLCEVEIIQSKELQIEVFPCSEIEVTSYLKDFSQYLLESKANNSDNSDGFKLSAEVERALRNMLNLNISRSKNDAGKRIANDSAKNFAQDYANTEDLVTAFLDRIKLAERIKTIFSNPEKEPQNKWLHKTFKAINSATDSQVSLAKRIVISIPESVFSNLDYSLSVVDTKGVDQTVNRQDLDCCFTNNRIVSVICCRFNEAPDKTMSGLLENAKSAGLTQRIPNETVLLILDREGEAAGVIDIDEAVGDKNEGRDIRSENVSSDLLHSLQLDNLDVNFIDIKTDDMSSLQKHLSNKVSAMRDIRFQSLQEIESAVSDIESELYSQSALQAKQQVKSTLEPWLKKAENCHPSLKEYFLPLIRNISDKGTYAASVRASVNRRGEWHNLDYYQTLAVGARQQIVEQIDSLKNELLVLIDNMLAQNELQPAYALLKQLKYTTEKRLDDIYQQTFAKGRAVYENKLTTDNVLWSELYSEWGQGSGYKGRVAKGSQSWFQHGKYPDIELSVTKVAVEKWLMYVSEIQDLLGREKS